MCVDVGAGGSAAGAAPNRRGSRPVTDDRPALEAMLARIRTMQDIDYVIVWKVDRLARNRRDDANMLFEIEYPGRHQPLIDQDTYRNADKPTRRTFNQAFFERIALEGDGEVTAAPFADETWSTLTDLATGDDSSAPSSKEPVLVGAGGFEPPTNCLRGNCSAVELRTRVTGSLYEAEQPEPTPHKKRRRN